MEYIVKLNNCGEEGNCPEPSEMQALIKAALAAVPEYHVYSIEVVPRWHQFGTFKSQG